MPTPAPALDLGAERAVPVPAPKRLTAVPHRWTFRRVGGLDQVVLESGEDLAHLDRLDQKLWVALSCPTRGLEIDPRTLDFLDTDGDGRVRVPEILAALSWCRSRLRDLGALVPGSPELPLDDINDHAPEGLAVLAAARRILAHLGRPGAAALAAADVADTTRVFDNTALNGDGVVTPESADDPQSCQVIADVMACAGGVRDRSGRDGIDQPRLDAFWKELQAYAAWLDEGDRAEVLTLGPATSAASQAVCGVRAKVDDFFTRCGFAAMDPRAATAMNRSPEELADLASRDLGGTKEELASFPLARIEAGGELLLDGAVNPAWAPAMAVLRRDAVTPLHGEAKASLCAAEWEDLKARVAPFANWAARKPAAAVEKLGAPRVRELLAGTAKAELDRLIAADLAVSAEAAAVEDAVRLVHFRRDLFKLLRNFVNFADFYARNETAIFQAGELFLDGRTCELCVRVDEPGAHAALASQSRMYLAYCTCRRAGAPPMTIAACFTQGDADYLMVGRNGIFYDRKGRDWDATIVKIVDNPISIRQAFWSPYKKFLRLVEEQVARFAAAKEKESDAKLAAGAAGSLPKAVDVGKMVGIVAALGVGIGAVGTILGGLVSGFMSLQWWAKIVAAVAMVLLISGPSVLIAWLKLRQRTLGPVLDATGWAVNGRVQVNVPLGTMLTARAVLPRGAARTLRDPYEDTGARTRHWLLALAAVLVIAALATARWYRVWPFG